MTSESCPECGVNLRGYNRSCPNSSCRWTDLSREDELSLFVKSHWRGIFGSISAFLLVFVGLPWAFVAIAGGPAAGDAERVATNRTSESASARDESGERVEPGNELLSSDSLRSDTSSAASPDVPAIGRAAVAELRETANQLGPLRSVFVGFRVRDLDQLRVTVSDQWYGMPCNQRERALTVLDRAWDATLDISSSVASVTLVDSYGAEVASTGVLGTSVDGC